MPINVVTEAEQVLEPPPDRAAWFIDYENIFIELSKKLRTLDPHVDRGDVVIRLLKRLRDRILSRGCVIILGRAYGNWDQAPGAGDSLALMSVQPVFVFSHPRKNSADLEMSLDAQEVMLLRTDIQHFVLVGGDRDYIPIVRRLTERGRDVTVAALESRASGDLKEVVGEQSFIGLEALTLELLELAEFPKPSEAEIALEPEERAQPESAAEQGTPKELAPAADDKQTALDLIIKALAERKDWEMPIVTFYKNYMNDAFSNLTETQRKALINELKEVGLIDLQIREGPYGGYSSSFGSHYLAIVVNPDHTTIRSRLAALFPGLTPDLLRKPKGDGET